MEMHPGDTVYMPAGEWHWHGRPGPLHDASRDVGGAVYGTETEWAEHVRDEEYSANP